jgi:hypothetical protein
MFHPPRQAAWLLLATVGLSSTLLGRSLRVGMGNRAVSSSLSTQGQAARPGQGKPAPAPAPAPGTPGRPVEKPNHGDLTLETLFAADSYKLFGEVRAVGGLIRSPGVVEFLEPIQKLSNPSKELKALIKFLNANSEALATSPMLFAAFPTRTGLPQSVVAIELPSVEEAQKFEPKLQTLLPVIFPSPSPTPTPSASPEGASGNKPVIGAGPAVAATDKPGATTALVAEEKKEPAGPSFNITRSGSLILITDAPFTFQKLRPKGSKLLAEDQNFRIARDRFSSEPLFIYYNVALEDEATRRAREAEAARREGQATEIEEKKTEIITVETVSENPPTPDASPSTAPTSTEEPEVVTAELAVIAQPEPPDAVQAPTPTPSDPFLTLLSSAISGGLPAWPDAVGAAVAFESDAYIVRVLLIDPPNTKTTPIPFLPQVISGSAISASAPAVLPADTEFYASASLDLPQMYARLLESLQGMSQDPRVSYTSSGEEVVMTTERPDTAATEAAFEKKYGFKIKEELLPALGSEVAIGGTMASLGLANEFGLPAPAKPPASSTGNSSQLTGATAKPEDEDAKSGPVFLLAVKDREAVKGLIPRLLDAMGLKALGLLAQTEKRADTELVTYAGAFSYAFVDRFLVLSPTPGSVRRVVDAYVNHDTLGANPLFRNLTRWQPRETQGQFYVAPSVMNGYNDLARNPAMPMDVAMREFVAKLNPAPAAISYALTNDGFGPLHELHLPKNLVLMMVAGVSATTNRTPLETNEEIGKAALYMISRAEAAYKEGKGKGSYGTLDQLIAENLLTKEMLEKYGYKIEVTAMGTRFEATATPKEYGTTGRFSFFVDETRVIKGGDLGGSPAGANDPPMP